MFSTFRGAGGLSPLDIQAAYNTMGIDMSLQDCTAIVQELDTQHSGVINFVDFYRAGYDDHDRPTTEEEWAFLFQSMDRDGDGLVDVTDIQTLFQR